MHVLWIPRVVLALLVLLLLLDVEVWIPEMGWEWSIWIKALDFVLTLLGLLVNHCLVEPAKVNLKVSSVA